VGNKSDIKGKVSERLLQEVETAEAQSYAKKRGYEYIQASASTGENINEVCLISKVDVRKSLYEGGGIYGRSKEDPSGLIVLHLSL